MTTPDPYFDQDGRDDDAVIFDFPTGRTSPGPDTRHRAEDDPDGADISVDGSPFDPDTEDADDFDHETVTDDAGRYAGPVDAVDNIPAAGVYHVTVSVNGVKVDKKTQPYPPHGTIGIRNNAGGLPTGGTF